MDGKLRKLSWLFTKEESVNKSKKLKAGKLGNGEGFTKEPRAKINHSSIRERLEAEETNAKKLRTKITDQVNDELWRVLNRKDDEHLMFANPVDLIEIWEISRLEQLSSGLDWSDQTMLKRAQKDFRQVLSTLVWIGWGDWSEFGNLFLEHRDGNNELDRSDKKLPLEDTSFLPTEQLQTFFRNKQYIFIPIMIMEDGGIHYEEHHEQYSDKYRLPFLRTLEIGQGGSGIVTKEVIGPGQFCFVGGVTTIEPVVIACKRIRREGTPGSWVDQRFLTEFKTLKYLRHSAGANKNIMPSYTAFEHDSNFVIISPLADLDLHTFFSGTYPNFLTRSQGFTPAHLLHGASCLAGALSFLHEGFQPRGIPEKIYCAHLDLKPENILVVWGNGEPEGRWLLHDFGISKIQKCPSPRVIIQDDFIRQFSLTKPRRAPGTFQAPEAEYGSEKLVGMESDIWSLGCILAVVLSFALGGPTFVRRLFNSNTHSNTQEIGEIINDFFYLKRDNRVILKEKTVDWLISLITGREEDVWIKETLAIIFDTLVEIPTARPSAKMIQKRLDAIYTMENIETLCNACSWAPATLSSIPPASTGTSYDQHYSYLHKTAGYFERSSSNAKKILKSPSLASVTTVQQLQTAPTPSIAQHEFPTPSLSSSSASESDTNRLRAEILTLFDIPGNWSGRGQHVEFSRKETIPLKEGALLGRGANADVHEVFCRDVRIARKQIFYGRRMKIEDVKRELDILKKINHNHIVTLLGSYTQHRVLGILLYPAAVCDLTTFLDDLDDAQGSQSNGELAFEGIFGLLQHLGIHQDGTLAPALARLKSAYGCITKAIQYLHENDIRHKDIKPRNILLDKNNRLYLTDFGISRDNTDASTSVTNGLERGTYKYCAPEVARLEPRGRAADIYALGCVFLEMNTVYRGLSLVKFDDFRMEDGDYSFQSNPSKLDEWMRHLRDIPYEKADGLGIFDILDLVTKMLSVTPANRPVIASVSAGLWLLDNHRGSYFGECCKDAVR